MDNISTSSHSNSSVTITPTTTSSDYNSGHQQMLTSISTTNVFSAMSSNMPKNAVTATSNASLATTSAPTGSAPSTNLSTSISTSSTNQIASSGGNIVTGSETTTNKNDSSNTTSEASGASTPSMIQTVPDDTADGGTSLISSASSIGSTNNSASGQLQPRAGNSTLTGNNSSSGTPVSNLVNGASNSTASQSAENTNGTSSVGASASNPLVILNKQRLQELVAEIDSREQLDEDVEDMLLTIADDFIDNLVTTSCMLAKHRGSKTVETKDIQLTLEKNYNIFIPGFGSLPLNEEFKHVYKKSPATEAHKQRMALIKKQLKKF